MRLRSGLGLLAVAALAGGPLALASQGPARPSQPSAGLTIAFSGDQNGMLTPCGCSEPMLGGLPRRAALLKTVVAKSAVVAAENGDLTQARGRQDELKAEAAIDSLNLMRYDAINLGEKDLALGLPLLRSLQARFHGTFLAAGLRDESGAPLGKDYLVVTRKSGDREVRVALIGLLSRSLTGGTNVKAEPANAVLSRLLPILNRDTDVRILLFHGPREEAEHIAKSHSEYDLIVYAHAGDHAPPDSHVGRTALVCSGPDGKYAGTARLSSAPPAVSYTALLAEVGEDTQVLAVKQGYVARVAAEDLLAQLPRTPLPAGDTFVGSQACAPCHAEASRIWQASPHARATATLEAQLEDCDPECIVCHAVGVEKIGGFRARAETPALTDVGCESCHGPGYKHSRDPRQPILRGGPESCTGCHNPQNSPRFRFETYWPKIHH